MEGRCRDGGAPFSVLGNGVERALGVDASLAADFDEFLHRGRPAPQVRATEAHAQGQRVGGRRATRSPASERGLNFGFGDGVGGGKLAGHVVILQHRQPGARLRVVFLRHFHGPNLADT